MRSFEFGAFHLQSSFKMKLIVSLSAVLLVIFGLGGYISYRINLRLFQEEISKQFHKANEQTLARLELQIQQVYRTSNYIVFHPYVEEIIQRSNRQNETTAYEEYYDRQELRELLDSVRLDAPKLNALYLYDLNGKLVFDKSDLSIDRIIQQDYAKLAKGAEGTEGGIVWKKMSLASSIEPTGFRDCFVAVRLMKTPKLEMYGLLIMIFDHTLFSSFLDELTSGEAGQVYLFDQRDQLLYTDDPDSIGIDPVALLSLRTTDIQTVHQTPYLFSKSYSDAVSFSLISRVSLEDIRSQSQSIFKIALYSALLSIAVSWILVMLTGQRLLRPLKLLVMGMRKLREGNFETRISIQSKDELGFLGQSFNSMAANIDSLIKEVYERRLNERDAEMKALQAQLNPHFLYNTLDTIYWSVYLKDDLDSARLVVSLSQLLRYALEPADKMTALNDEIRQIENYLHIQQVRFKDDLRTAIVIDEEVQNCLVIRLILQPLVENIFIHAFRDKQSGQLIEIRACRSGGKLVIEIADNGCGMSEETVRRLTAADKAQPAEREGRESIGIQSVIRRIELIYGSGYGLEIESKPGRGTVMRLLLPFRLKEELKGKQKA